MAEQITVKQVVKDIYILFKERENLWKKRMNKDFILSAGMEVKERILSTIKEKNEEIYEKGRILKRLTESKTIVYKDMVLVEEGDSFTDLNPSFVKFIKDQPFWKKFLP